MTLAVRTFSTKLLIGWLATGTRMEKYGNRITDCHRCGGVETVDHLFRCPENRDLFNTFLTDLKSFLVLIKTKPAIMDDMVNGIQLWASEENASGFCASQRMTQRYRDSAQTRIGFNLLLRGILTSDWSERQQVYLIDVNGGVRGTEADTWSSKLSTWLINQAHDLWKARNEELHRPMAPDNSQIARAALELQERVRELYDQKDDVNFQDRDLFEIPLESRLQHSVSIMRAWVESTSKTLGICIEDFATATARGNSDIRDQLPIRVVGEQQNPTVPTRAAAATLDSPEVHELVDTSSNDSTMDSSTSSASSGLQRVRAMFNRALGRPKRRRKPKTNTTIEATQRKAKAKEQESDTESETSDSDQENKDPPIARKFTPKAKAKKTKQSNITSYFGMGNKDKQQTPTANEKEVETARQNHQQWSSPQPVRHRRWEVSTGSRVWDAGRTNREGGGGPARVAKFRDRSTQQLGSAADSTPVVL
jgi:predicted Rdx family selenoprotein